MLPWLLCDYAGLERDMRLAKYRILVLLISLLGLVVPLFEARPVIVMIVSQAFNAVILPITVACIFYLSNRKDLMGEHCSSATGNIVLTAILLFSLFTSSVSVRGVLQLLQHF